MKSPEHAVDDFGPYSGHTGALAVDFDAGLGAKGGILLGNGLLSRRRKRQ